MLRIRAVAESSDDGVPGEAIGCLDLVEYSTSMVYISVTGEGVESEDFGSGERVVDLAGFDEVGMDLLQVFEGFACFDLWEL